jgi:hypothetical protein
MRRQPSPTALIFSDDKPQISGTFTQIGAASRRAPRQRAARETPPVAVWSRPLWGYCAALLSARPAAVMSFPIPSIVLQAPTAPAKPRIRTAAMIRRSMGIQPSILTDRRTTLLGLVGDCLSRSNAWGRISPGFSHCARERPLLRIQDDVKPEKKPPGPAIGSEPGGVRTARLVPIYVRISLLDARVRWLRRTCPCPP